MGKNEQDRFIASKDVVDRLKSENSVVSSEFATMTPLLVAKVISTVANTYYPYIPTETLERLKDLPQRVIVTDISKFNNINNPTGEDRQDRDGFFTYRGNFIIIKNPESMGYVWEMMPEKGKQSWVQAYGNQEEAKKAACEQRFARVLIHEVVHGFHPSIGELSIGFVENGVNYYVREIASEAGIVNFSVYATWEADIYKSFLNNYGESAHRVFFGLESNEEQVRLFTEDYKKQAEGFLKQLDLDF